MKIDFNPYALVYTDDTDIYDVYFIIIDETEKTIDLCDSNGFSIGNVHYENSKEIGCLYYDDNERLNGDSDIIVKNGELIKGVDNNV